MSDLFKNKAQRYQFDIGLLALRITASALMMPHGYSKLMRLFSEAPIQFPDPLMISPALSLFFACVAELFCSILIMVGYMTRGASLFLMITMTVVVLGIHLLEATGKHELPMLYLIVFTTISIMGGGKYSIDYLMEERLKRRYY